MFVLYFNITLNFIDNTKKNIWQNDLYTKKPKQRLWSSSGFNSSQPTQSGQPNQRGGLRDITRSLTGYCRLNRHMKIMGLVESEKMQILPRNGGNSPTQSERMRTARPTQTRPNGEASADPGRCET
jgi:hypothetical protein